MCRVRKFIQTFANWWISIRLSAICVVHIARAVNGVRVFQNFINSYKKHLAGIQHDFVLIYKGFDRAVPLKALPEEYSRLLQDVDYELLLLPDIGFDIGPYFMLARKRTNPYFTFLNSFSEILDDNWLRKMHNKVSRPGVGLVGASGSWGSLYSDLANTW